MHKWCNQTKEENEVEKINSNKKKFKSWSISSNYKLPWLCNLPWSMDYCTLVKKIQQWSCDLNVTTWQISNIYIYNQQNLYVIQVSRIDSFVLVSHNTFWDKRGFLTLTFLINKPSLQLIITKLNRINPNIPCIYHSWISLRCRKTLLLLQIKRLG